MKISLTPTPSTFKCREFNAFRKKFESTLSLEAPKRLQRIPQTFSKSQQGIILQLHFLASKFLTTHFRQYNSAYKNENFLSMHNLQWIKQHQNLVLSSNKLNKTNPVCFLQIYSEESEILFATYNEIKIYSQSRIFHLIITNTSSYFLIF